MANLLQWFKNLFGSSSAPKRSQAGLSGDSKTGTITFFNWTKGYGFIESPGIEGRIFLHRTKVKGRAKIGDEVRFELGKNNKGLFAKRAELI
jgi:CspA family cold shock protein